MAGRLAPQEDLVTQDEAMGLIEAAARALAAVELSALPPRALRELEAAAVALARARGAVRAAADGGHAPACLCEPCTDSRRPRWAARTG